METEALRQALVTEIERATSARGGEVTTPGPDGAGTTSEERLAGYRAGLEFALGLIGAAPTFSEEVVEPGSQEVVQPGSDQVLQPEPELIDQVERVRTTEA